MNCTKCNYELSDEFKYCPMCGASVLSMRAEMTKNVKHISAVSPSKVPNMVFVQGGFFVMGMNEANRKVAVLSFQIGETPVTQRQYEHVMEKNPSKLKGPDKPVECVNWCEAIAFCNRLSQMQNLTPCYSIGNVTDLSTFESSSPVWKRITCNFTATGFRLPTEAEWEYAARGGKYLKPAQFAGSDDIKKVAWYGENSDITSHDVATKAGNQLGLFDMCGNVAEWCWDYMGELPSGPMTNPHGPSIGSMHVKRGGSWLDDAQQCTVFYRSGSAPTGKSSNLGFRVCRSVIENVM